MPVGPTTATSLFMPSGKAAELRGLLDDADELSWLEAGPADQGAVDLWPAHELGDIFGGHAAAVKDAQAVGDAGAVPLRDLAAG